MVRVPGHAWRFVTAILFGCLIAGCGGNGPPNPMPASGVQGQTTRGPISPVSQPGQSNEAPLPGAVVVVQQQNGREVARQTSDAQGNFSIAVSPGAYQVVGLSMNGNAGLPTPPAPQQVTVTANQYATVNLSYDTGIR